MYSLLKNFKIIYFILSQFHACILCILVISASRSPFHFSKIFLSHTSSSHLHVFSIFFFENLTHRVQLVLPAGMLIDVDDLILSRQPELHSIHEYNGHVMSRRQNFTASLPIFWPFHSFCSLLLYAPRHREWLMSPLGTEHSTLTYFWHFDQLGVCAWTTERGFPGQGWEQN